jgi:hypothetical protein
MKSKQFILIRGRVRWIHIYLFVVALVAVTTRPLVVRADGWTRARPLVTLPESDVVFEPFVLNVWSGDGPHVYGLCAYHNAKPTPITIEGRETPNGHFYPDVVNQVSNVKDGKWQTLEALTKIPGKPTILAVEARGTSKTLRVDLDVFIPLIGKMKYGRLLLKSGESAVFQLDDLQPPGKKTDSSVDAVKTEQ